MRIVAGRFKGRPLAGPKSEAIRPTSDRVRESLFNILDHGIADFSIEGARVLDLFAGTGALGLEAVSRGAASCLFVEEDAQARGLIRANVEAMALTGITKLFRRDATSLGPAGKLGQFDLVLLDPPYGSGAGHVALDKMLRLGWVGPASWVSLETHADEVVTIKGLSIVAERKVGKARITLLRADPTPTSIADAS